MIIIKNMCHFVQSRKGLGGKYYGNRLDLFIIIINDSLANGYSMTKKIDAEKVEFTTICWIGFYFSILLVWGYYIWLYSQNIGITDT